MDTHQGSAATAVTELQGTAEQGRLVLVEVLDRIEAAFPAAAGRHRLGPGAWLVPLGVGGGGSMLIAIAPAGRPRERGNAQLVLSATLVDRADLPEADAARALGCLDGVPFTGYETEAFAKQLPLVAGLPERVADKPLGECGVVLVGHLLSDLVVQAQTLMALGARPEAMTVLAKDYPYKLRARVEAHLASLGIAVLPVADAEIALRLHAARVVEPSVVIDDGGHVLPTLMKLAPDLLPRFQGLVEQSLPGIEELEVAEEAMPVPVPVFSVAQSAVKRGVEAHWIAESVVRAIRELLAGENFDGAPALVVGYGMVGEQVAQVLRTQRMRVAVHDTEWRKLVAAHEAGFLTAPDLPALLDGHRPALIVSATGRTGLGGEDLDFLPGDCFLASVSARGTEIDMPGLAERAERVEEVAHVGMRYVLPNGPVTVLADGLSVNGPRGDRVPTRQSDLTLAALVWGACTLARPGHGFAAGHDVARTDASIAESGLVERYYRLYGPDR
ncbi:S-adenosyl-L-homocysteine hydrolase, NAD binding [Catenulispora acidiphila DSM 44928]|uniref:S-adenosyl-L-homocysteine hydrolase, NAD binding n=1 Tax=Catenulispora acidiphila (strain DSM 44928 / JCM 14897 / NBRC 102108 / NRRL B-24433 / ID139908) TaxID=479433 RepID=C7Q1U7_CATAD|nr:S-adenosyl-L-homocysteine hydrolase NAD-binding protein [Catenulispora acidiphila]ACU75648.1 S-adenosyl-L-homocysteine hydrolase, NAD binding [Catenulispora acidiphila DSM 44928]